MCLSGGSLPDSPERTPVRETDDGLSPSSEGPAMTSSEQLVEEVEATCRAVPVSKL